MRNNYSFLQSGLEIAVILLLVVTSIGSIANQKLHSEEAKNVAMQSEVITKPGYIQFPNKPYTTAIYDENSENNKPFKTKHLQRPRLLETEGHPYKGTNTYQKLEKPVVEVNGDIAESPFDFTQKVELCCDKTKYAGNTFYSHPYEPVTVNQENTPAVLQNFALCFRIHVPDLYNNATFVFSPTSIILLDSDGETLLPFWIQDDYHREILIWTCLPSYNPSVPKALYIASNKNGDYSSIDPTYAFSNFESVFSSRETGLTGKYQFRLNKVGSFTELLDMSGHYHNGVLSGFCWGEELMGAGSYRGHENKKLRYCKIPNENQTVLSLQKGSVDIIVDYRGGSLSLHASYSAKDGYINDKAVFFEDTNQNFSLYYFQGALYWDYVNNNQKVQMKTTLPESFNERMYPLFQIGCSWNQTLNQFDLYLDGEKQKNVEISVLSEVTNNKMGDLIIGSFLDPGAFPYSFIPSVYLYNTNVRSDVMLETMKEHWIVQNPMITSELQNFYGVIEKNSPNFDTIEAGDTLYYDLFYAAPIRSERYYYQYYGVEEKDRDTNVLFKEETEWQPVFGIPGHFYSYTGTFIKVKNPCIVEYITLKMNHPELIKELNIEFLYTTYSTLSTKETNSSLVSKWFQQIEIAWNKLVPRVEACGPFYSHRSYGESLLELVSFENDNYTYRLKKPIYIDENADFMQINFKNANHLGWFSIAVENIFVYSDNHYSKAVYAPDIQMKNSHPYSKQWNEEKKTFEVPISGDSVMSIYPDFKVYLLGEENGTIEVKVQENGKVLAFVFMNKGKTPITISKDSLVAMQSGYKNEKWTGLQCWPVFKGSHQKNSIVEMDIPFNNLLGKTIQPGESISLPFLNWNKYKRKEGFKSATSIVINKVMKEAITLILPVASVKEQKIILWGEDVWSFYKYGNSNKAFHVNILSDDTLEIEK